MLKLSGVAKALGREKHQALRDISLEVGAGTVFGLIGPNGAGKTTTVRVCSTLLSPDSGSVEVCGIDALANPREARKHIGLMFGGDLGFYPRVSAQDNLEFFAHLADIDRREISKEIDRVLELVTLSDRRSDKVGGFSRGMKQRLHLARAMLGSPEVVLLDEPTTGLDPDKALDVRTIIGQLAQSGTAVLLTSHSMSEISELSTELGVIGAGEIVVTGQVSDIAQAAGIAAVTSFSLAADTALTSSDFSSFEGVSSVSMRPDGNRWSVALFLSDADAGQLIESRLESLATEKRRGATSPDLTARPATDADSTAGSSQPKELIANFVTREPSLEECYLAYAERLQR